MALCAVLTAVASLLMSIGLCCFFGLTLTISWREMYPYLAMVVGIENIFVLSKAVYNTSNHLDVKIRIAQGLSKEGWSITYNLLTEVKFSYYLASLMHVKITLQYLSVPGDTDMYIVHVHTGQYIRLPISTLLELCSSVWLRCHGH